MKVQIKFWKAKKSDLTRFYITADGEQVGYIQESFEARGNKTYYDSHRNAKGDNEVAITSDNLPGEFKTKLLAKFNVTDVDGGVHFDMPAIKRLTAGQPILKGSKLAFSKGEVIEL